MNEFKVGDKVKIIKLFVYDPFEVGDIGEVERIIDRDGVSVKFATGSYPMLNGQLELIKKNPMKKFVVTDVRRDSEVAALVSLGFTMVAISADKEARVARLIARDGSYDPKWEKNIAESEIESLMNNRCGFTVDNNGTKEELQTQAGILLATIG